MRSLVERKLLREALADGSYNPTLIQFQEDFGTADFTNVLLDAANVSAMEGFGAVLPEWKKLFKVKPRNDFKVNNIVLAEGMGYLEKLVEKEGYSVVKPSDSKETYSLGIFGKIFRFPCRPGLMMLPGSSMTFLADSVPPGR